MLNFSFSNLGPGSSILKLTRDCRIAKFWALGELADDDAFSSIVASSLTAAFSGDGREDLSTVY